MSLCLSLPFALYPHPVQSKKVFEKVGESTEVALKVLAEKLNLQGTDRASLSLKERACDVCNTVSREFEKVCVGVAQTCQGLRCVVDTSFTDLSPVHNMTQF